MPSRVGSPEHDSIDAGAVSASVGGVDIGIPSTGTISTVLSGSVDGPLANSISDPLGWASTDLNIDIGLSDPYLPGATPVDPAGTSDDWSAWFTMFGQAGALEGDPLSWMAT